MGTGRLLAGTSGYSYPEWKPAFYPEDLPQSKFLDFYAQRLATVEINNTFYRFPSESLFEGWRATAPDGFTFAVKANQRITHKERLKDVEGLVRDFAERCQVLGDKLGPILFQLPPFQRREDERLAGFLEGLPPGARYAIEFRHKSWFEDEVLDVLRGKNVALVNSEDDKLAAPRVATADFCYLRLRREAYTDEELADWRTWIGGQCGEGRDVYAYLKHDKKGESPERALKLLSSGDG